jgi:hypothetical protein
MAGLTPFPELPQKWIPVMGLPFSEFPEVTISALEGERATKSFRNWRWSAYAWYELNHVLLAEPAGVAC